MLDVTLYVPPKSADTLAMLLRREWKNGIVNVRLSWDVEKFAPIHLECENDTALAFLEEFVDSRIAEEYQIVVN